MGTAASDLICAGVRNNKMISHTGLGGALGRGNGGGQRSDKRQNIQNKRIAASGDGMFVACLLKWEGGITGTHKREVVSPVLM